MGQSLSCAAKPKAVDDGQKPDNVKEKKKIKTDTHIVATTVPATNAAKTEISTVKKEIIFLPSAPSNFKLPHVASEVAKDKNGNYVPGITPVLEGDLKNVISLSTHKHTDHQVDSNARRIAQDSEIPLCWKDLYWNLIGCKNLSSDEEKVSALFCWLVSRPSDDAIFADNENAVKKRKNAKCDSPDVVLSNFSIGKANYVQAFESMCRYSGISCVTVHGIAKNQEYRVGQPLLRQGEQLFNPETGALPTSLASLQHYWNAALIDGKWRLFDVTWAAKRLSRESHGITTDSTKDLTVQYKTDMFYYETDPAELIFTHYPFEDTWQLISPPVSIVNFATWPLVKPAFFQNGLSLFSHREGFIAIETQMVLTLKMLPENVEQLMFTYQLNLEDFGNVDAGVNRTRFGIHEISKEESSVIFRFRMPKKGDYTLVIYARHSGEQLFSDVCEYKISAIGSTKDVPLVATPFPPTNQANYGPTQKAIEYGLETLPRQLAPLIKSPNGGVELRFIAADAECKIPRLTARLKSVTVKAEFLEDCILLRDIEATLPSTGVSMLTGMGPCVPMTVLNAYLPEKGEYAIEVYAAPPSSENEDNDAYHLAWQFLVESQSGKPLSPSIRSRLGTMNLGAQDETWHRLGFRTFSHPDPLIRIRTTGKADAGKLFKDKLSAQILQKFMSESNDLEAVEVEHVPEKVEGSKEEIEYSREDADLEIILGLPEQQKIFLIGQMVDISGDEEEDVTGYLLKRRHNGVDQEDDLSGDRTSKSNSADYALEQPSQLVQFLVRIPRGGTFYKLYIYAIVADEEVTESIPLVYTYLIDAPLRLTAAESPYIGITAGEFPQNIERKNAAQLSASKFQRIPPTTE